MTDATVETDGHGGLWITLPSGRRYHRPAEPLLDHPGLLTGPGPADPTVDTTASDPDPPDEKDGERPSADDDTPPF